MKLSATILVVFGAFILSFAVRPSVQFESAGTTVGAQKEKQFYLGFDRNQYPGDRALPMLRQTFSFTGYWLTPPPMETQNSWTGKRKTLSAKGFGFLLLAEGREFAAIQSGAKEDGIRDASDAARSATQEGFPKGSIIFLDIEEGGRLLPQVHSYLRAWADELVQKGFKPGVYCSGIPVNEPNGHTIVTADDIRSKEGPRDIAFWVFNDMCPPSPGCTRPMRMTGPAKSGVKYASVWQFVRSPRPKGTASACAGYANDENCYAAFDVAHRWHLDLDVASSKNPSAPR
jgi:hypothetical protein